MRVFSSYQNTHIYFFPSQKLKSKRHDKKKSSFKKKIHNVAKSCCVDAKIRLYVNSNSTSKRGERNKVKVVFFFSFFGTIANTNVFWSS